jgi:hypothetical protein
LGKRRGDGVDAGERWQDGFVLSGEEGKGREQGRGGRKKRERERERERAGTLASSRRGGREEGQRQRQGMRASSFTSVYMSEINERFQMKGVVYQ